eukprot:1154630-Pelagomonas_calceolata.AAC.3
MGCGRCACDGRDGLWQAHAMGDYKQVHDGVERTTLESFLFAANPMQAKSHSMSGWSALQCACRGLPSVP